MKGTPPFCWIRTTFTYGPVTRSCSLLYQTRSVNPIWRVALLIIDTEPLKDKSFTCTLFAPTSELDRLKNPELVLPWFKLHFPDAVTLMGEKPLLGDFTTNPRSPLICTKVLTRIISPCFFRSDHISDSRHRIIIWIGPSSWVMLLTRWYPFTAKA